MKTAGQKVETIGTPSDGATSKNNSDQVQVSSPEPGRLNAFEASESRPQIISLETAVPPYYVSQKDAFSYLVKCFPQFSEMADIFINSGIDGRYSSVPLKWFDQPKGWKESNQTYIANTLELLQDATMRALAAAALAPEDIDAVVLVSSTGFAMPSLDARLAERMSFRSDVERTPISGLGCAGGVTGMARAATLARAAPGSNVLLIVIELEGLNTHMKASNGAFLISSALFGDGATAAIIRAGIPNGKEVNPVIGPTGEARFSSTLELMGWEFADEGLDVVLSGKVPSFIRDELEAVACQFLDRHGLTLEEIDGFLVHPGGPKVLDAIQGSLNLDTGSLTLSRDVLRNYGNMSSPTVLFILKQAMRIGKRGRHLMVAPGPGLTISFAIVEL